MRITGAESYAELRDSISHDWIHRLVGWGMTPFPIPNVLRDPVAYFDALVPDLLLLTGGDDPGATPERDATETRLLARAAARGCPVLGVCRGMQLINRHFGGGLRPVAGHVATRHPIAVEAPLRALYGAETTVNSFHALGIGSDDLASGLLAAAADAEGFIEALVDPTQAIAAVMWHPERPGAPEADRRLVERLIAEGAFWA